MKKLAILIALVLCVPSLALAKAKKAPATYYQAVEKGADWLAKTQNANGSFGRFPGMKVPGDVGITGVVLMGFAQCPKSVQAKHKAVIEKAVAYILKHQAKNGCFLNKGRGMYNYKTCVSVMALARLDRQRFKKQIELGKQYLVSTQFSEKHKNVKPDNWHYGGWDYKDGGLSADMSNVQYALEALKAAGLDKNSPVWKRAQKFLQRSHNDSETNDLKFFVVLNDGGFMYYPGNTKADTIKVKGGTAHPSYASMTYAGLKSYIYCNVPKSDRRVKAAYNWIRRNYTLEENKGLTSAKKPKGGQQGLFYYYHTFAKTMSVWGKPYIVTADGQKHRWAKELGDKLVGKQSKAGFWINPESRWWEKDPQLVTSYSLIALNLCIQDLEKK